MQHWQKVALTIALAGGLWHWANRPPAERVRPPGVVAPSPPVQRAFAQEPPPIRHGEFQLQPLASFSTEARLLSRMRYRMDEEAKLSPFDFALGWGRMSDSAVLARLDYDQSSRFFTYRYEQPPIPHQEIDRSIANVHLIPADDSIARLLSAVPVGEVVGLEGWLVEARRDDGWRWRSSMTREDTGAGACELLYVRAVYREAGAAD